MSTIRTIIDASLRLIGVYHTSPQQYSDAISNLVSMLDSWSLQPGVIPILSKISVELSAGTEYTTLQNVSLIQGIQYNGSVLQKLSDFEWFLTDKNDTAATPLCWYRSLDKIYLYPVPSSAITVDICYRACLDNTLELTDILELTLAFEYAIKYNLAVRLAPEYGREASRLIQINAATSMKSILKPLSRSKQIGEDSSGSVGGVGGVGSNTVPPDTVVSIIAPIAGSSYNNLESVTYTASTATPGFTDSDHTFVWSFDDGSPDQTGITVEKVWITLGNHIATVVARNTIIGLSDSASVAISVTYPETLVTITGDAEPVINVPTTYTAHPVTEGYSEASHTILWEFSDNTTGSGLTYDKTWNTIGEKLVTCTATQPATGNHGHDTLTVEVVTPATVKPIWDEIYQTVTQFGMSSWYPSMLLYDGRIMLLNEQDDKYYFLSESNVLSEGGSFDVTHRIDVDNYSVYTTKSALQSGLVAFPSAYNTSKAEIFDSNSNTWSTQDFSLITDEAEILAVKDGTEWFAIGSVRGSSLGIAIERGSSSFSSVHMIESENLVDRTAFLTEMSDDRVLITWAGSTSTMLYDLTTDTYSFLLFPSAYGISTWGTGTKMVGTSNGWAFIWTEGVSGLLGIDTHTAWVQCAANSYDADAGCNLFLFSIGDKVWCSGYLPNHDGVASIWIYDPLTNTYPYTEVVIDDTRLRDPQYITRRGDQLVGIYGDWFDPYSKVIGTVEWNVEGSGTWGA